MSFYTETIAIDPRFASLENIRDTSLLEPITRKAIECIIDAAKAEEIILVITETYRSTQRQVDLFNEGKTKLRTVGVHHYGLACDFMKAGQKDPWAGDWSFLGRLAKQFGLVWGGDWGSPGIKHSFVDSDHVQRCSLLDQSRLFQGLWYPDDNYDPYGG